MLSNIRARYDRVSPAYDISRQANNETVKKLVKLIDVNSETILLDMGCGTGNYTAAFRQRSQNIIGVDLSLSMLKQAQKKISDSPFLCGDVVSLPFSDGTFEGALAMQVLHHIQKKDDFLREAHRVLKVGSNIALHSCSHRQMQEVWFYHYFPKGLVIDLARIPDIDVICLLLERAGFSNIGVEICHHDVVVSHETPDRYLDKKYRDGISTFAFLTDDEIELGCDKIRRDITSGDIERIVRLSEAKVLNEVGGSSIIYGQKINTLY